MLLSPHNGTDDFIKYISSDDALFHYTQRATALENILYEGSFKFSYLKNSNDPYEYSPKLFGAGGYSWDDGVKEHIDSTEDILESIFAKQTLFISFCSNEFEDNSLISCGFLKLRMWAQYGENHKGVCLIFSKEKLSNLFKNQFAQDQYMTFDGYIDYVEYVNADVDHIVLAIDHDTFNNFHPENIAFKHLEKYHKKLFFRKPFDYRDEQEYRFVIVKKNDQGPYTMEPLFKIEGCLKGIILGDKFSVVYYPTIKSVCNKMNIQCKKLHWNSDEFIPINI